MSEEKRSWKKFGAVLLLFFAYMSLLWYLLTATDPLTAIRIIQVVCVAGLIGFVVAFAWLVSAPSVIARETTKDVGK